MRSPGNNQAEMTGLMKPANSSPELIRRAQSGDRQAFEELVHLYRERIEKVIVQRLRDHQMTNVDVSDVLQETLLRSYRSVTRFEWRGEESFLRWLGGIVENVVLEIARRGARHPAFQLEHDVSADRVSPSRAMRQDERFDRLHDAIKNLSSEYRDVIMLSRIEGLTFEEIAGRMNRSPAAVKQLLWRALKKLKESFGDTESLHLPGRSFREGENDDQR